MAPALEAAGTGAVRRRRLALIAGRLDPASRRVAFGLGLRLSALAALPAPALAGGRSLGQYLAMILILFLGGAALAAALAVIRGERPGGPCLNFWDESGAFCLAAALAAAGAALTG